MNILRGVPAGMIVFLLGSAISMICEAVWGRHSVSIGVVGVVTVVIAIGCVIGFPLAANFREKKAEEQRRQKAAAAEEMRRQETERRKQQEEKNRIDEVHSIRNSMLSVFNRLPEHLKEADIAINLAENEFHEGAFAPFWDEIERATNLLARYQHGIERVRESIPQEWSSNAALLKPLPAFSIQLCKLPDAKSIVARLQSIVRLAQKDFHFASIYEQRKTNQILVAGFGSLASAINNVGSRITASIRQLSTDLSVSLDSILNATDQQTEMLSSGMSALSEQISNESNAQREYEKNMLEKQDKQIQLLDNRKR